MFIFYLFQVSVQRYGIFRLSTVFVCLFVFPDMFLPWSTYLFSRVLFTNESCLHTNAFTVCMYIFKVKVKRQQLSRVLSRLQTYIRNLTTHRKCLHPDPSQVRLIINISDQWKQHVKHFMNCVNSLSKTYLFIGAHVVTYV